MILFILSALLPIGLGDVVSDEVLAANGETDWGESVRKDVGASVVGAPAIDAQPKPHPAFQALDLQGNARETRRTCEIVGDPHCKGFHGNHFDIQTTGVFRVLQLNGGTEQVQMRTYPCEKPLPWSAGLTVKCVDAIAVRMADGNVFTVHRKQGTKINGVDCVGDNALPSALKVSCHGVEGGTYHGRLIEVLVKRRRWRGEGILDLFVSLKGRASSKNNNGVCGNPTAMQAGNANLGRFPCRNCTARVGMFGAICPCTEFLTDSLLFRNMSSAPKPPPSPPPRETSPTASPKVEEKRLQFELDTDCLGMLSQVPTWVWKELKGMNRDGSGREASSLLNINIGEWGTKDGRTARAHRLLRENRGGKARDSTRIALGVGEPCCA